MFASKNDPVSLFLGFVFLVAIVFGIVYWIRTRKKWKPPVNPTAKYWLYFAGTLLEAYEDKIKIIPVGWAASSRLRGTKMIPLSSVTAITFKKAGSFLGHIQFSIKGAVEKGDGMIFRGSDVNTVQFSRAQNQQAEQICDFIECKITT